MMIENIRRITTDRILHLRAIERILSTDKFTKAFDRASEKQRNTLFIIIYNSDKEALSSWIKKIGNNRNIFELWEEARKLRIINFRRLSKEKLLYEIGRMYEKDVPSENCTTTGC